MQVAFSFETRCIINLSDLPAPPSSLALLGLTPREIWLDMSARQISYRISAVFTSRCAADGGRNFLSACAARRAPADARRRTHFEFVVRSLKSFACFAAVNGYQQKLNQNIKLNFTTGPNVLIYYQNQFKEVCEKRRVPAFGGRTDG